MKKLFLTSFTFKTGETEYTTQRLVIAPTKDVAYRKAEKWFPTQYPESELISYITHEAIDDVEDSGRFPYTHAPKVAEPGCDYSIDVLVDLDGTGYDYRIGWYDWDLKKWLFHEADISKLNKDKMRWEYLPRPKSEVRPA